MADARLAQLSEGWYVWVPTFKTKGSALTYGPFSLADATAFARRWAEVRPEGGVLLLSPVAEQRADGITWFCQGATVPR